MLTRLSFLFLSVSAAICAFADNRPFVDVQIDSTLKSNKVVYIDGKPTDDRTLHYVDSVRRVISAFYYDQFRHFQDPGAPYFLFLSKDANLAMGMGGAVRMRAYYDWDGAIPASGFAPILIPMKPSPTAMRNFDTTPAGTCLFFRVLGRNKTLGEYQLYIEANFNGYNSRDLHLKKAYAIINDFTIGYASSTFSDPAAVPPTVDAQGPNNKITPTSVLVRYMPVVKNKWYFAVSAETPSKSIDTDDRMTASVKNWMPDFAAFVQYEWARGQHIRIAGIARTLSYRNLVSGSNCNKVGWGVQLSSVARPLRELTSYLTVSYGKGHESLGGDLLIGNHDLVAITDRPGEMYAPAAFGWCLGLQYNFRPNLFMCVSASESHYLLRDGASPDEYRRGLFAAVNVFWNMTPRIQVGAEFDLGRRENISGEHRYAKRVGAVCQFSF